MKNQESGRSLIEMLGVLALAGIITGSAITMYTKIKTRQTHLIANSFLEDVVSKTNLLFSYTGDYSNISVDFLIKSGVLQNNSAPIGNNDWTITPNTDNSNFIINLTGLSYTDCSYFIAKQPTWASVITINNSSDNLCLKTGDNNISFFVK